MPHDPPTDDFLIESIVSGPAAGLLETDAMPEARAFRLSPRLRFMRWGQKQHLRDLLQAPPACGESIHVAGGGTFEFGTWLSVAADWIGKADSLYCATWTVSRANATELFQLADAGRVGSIGLVVGKYFRQREAGTFAFLADGLRQRGGKFRSAKSHAKCLLLDSAAADTYLSIEGSANLTGNPSFEQYVITNDAGLWRFHRSWFDEVLTSKQDQAETTDATRSPRSGFSQRRAGLGVLTVSRDKATRQQILAWKANPEEDEGQTAAFADVLAALIHKALPVRPSGCVLTIPPQGASWPGMYYARLLGRRVAHRLNMPLAEIIARTDEKHHHGRRASLDQEPYAVSTTAPAAVVIDDLITSGNTLRMSLDALRAAEIPCWGFALNGS
jgi:hypothetical protein